MRLARVDVEASNGLPQQFREHFGHRDHLYGELLARLADDLEAGGPTADICRGHLGAPRGDAVQLRLLAGVFRIVLRGDAPELERFYPSLGGAAPPDQVWPPFRAVLAAQVGAAGSAGPCSPDQRHHHGPPVLLR